MCIVNVTFIRDPGKVSREKNTHHTYSPIDMAREEGLMRRGAGRWPLYKHARPFNCTIHAVSQSHGGYMIGYVCVVCT